jgi:uncharacterized protein
MASPLLDKLLADIKEAMKARANDKLVALRMLHSEIKNLTTNAGKEATDDDVIAAVNKAIKQRADAAEQYRAGGREDLAAQELAEIEAFRRYQPAQLDRAAIEDLARQAVAESGAAGKKDAGKVMQILMPKVKGRADGRIVNQVVQALLP